LASFAVAEFALEVRQKDGHKLRDHLNSAWDQSGVMPEEFDYPPIPEAIKYLWYYFIELHNRRGNFGYGHVPLLFSEIYHWKLLKLRKLDPWELDAILIIDSAYLASLDKKPGSEGST
jgi:hypothetical protein